MKFILTTVMTTILFSSIGLSASAQIVPQVTPPTDYKLLAPLPGLTTNGQTTDINTYIPNAIKLIIGLAIALAVLMIIWGGFEYILSASVNTKSDGRERIKDALIGLLLVISSYVILNTINPNLVKFNISLVNVGTTTPIGLGLGTTTPSGGGGGSYGTTAGAAWGDDTANRNSLTKTGIMINNPNCATVGQTGCTSLLGLFGTAISGLIQLKSACNCSITLTGGTEYWLHGNRSTEIDQNPTPHKPGDAVVDLSLNTDVTSFLRQNGTKSTDYSSCVIGKNNGAERYTFQGGTYVNETIDGNVPHWHVCY